MKLYIKACSSYKGDIKEFNVKKELKQKYKLDTRRQDTFIHLAVYGAQKLKENTDISRDDELYVTSGVGNIDVLQKTNNYVHRLNEFIKPFDFINMLGNTTSYYVASSLGVKGKNTFQISDNFTYINTLISIFASLNVSNKDAILGSIDLATQPDEVIKRVLGLDEATEVTSSVNYQKFSLSEDDSIASVEFDTKIYSLSEIKELIEKSSSKVFSSMRCEELETQKEGGYFETMASFAVNRGIETKEDLIYIDCYEGAYKVLNLTII
ncbi:MAG: hypothetical protein ABFQ64_00180 [Campylobacterota bacterium]